MSEEKDYRSVTSGSSITICEPCPSQDNCSPYKCSCDIRLSEPDTKKLSYALYVFEDGSVAYEDDQDGFHNVEHFQLTFKAPHATRRIESDGFKEWIRGKFRSGW